MAAGSLATLFKTLRARSGLSQEQLAERAGLSHRTIGDIESGVIRRRRPVTMRLLADALGASSQERTALLEASLAEGLNAPGEVHRRRPRLPPATELIGRDAALEQLERYFRVGTAFVTITGPPGVGKTSLALRAAVDLEPGFPGGAAFVALDTIAGAAAVLPLVARSLGIEDRDRGAQLHEMLVERLQAERTLLVLDNVEHLLDAGPALAALLRSAPGTSVLATGRSPFNLIDEHEVVLAPLAANDAAALFIQRARSALGGYAPDPQEREAVDRICASLEGLPLAIELAAQRVRSFSAAELASHIWELLGQGPRDAPPRHQALDAAIAWSYDLLDEQARRAFRQFAVFRGGATVEAAYAVCDMHAPGIDALVRQNLLVVEGSGRERRLRMLVPIREFAVAKLREASEEFSTGERHARYYCELARQMNGRTRETFRAALAGFDAERQNFSAALGWAREHGAWAVGARLAAALGDFWIVRGALADAREWCEAFADAAAQAGGDSLLYGEALIDAAYFNIKLNELDRARSYAERARSLGDEHGDALTVAWALTVAGTIEYVGGNVREARSVQERALESAGEIGDPRLLAYVQRSLGSASLELGEVERAIRENERAVAYSTQAGFETQALLPMLSLAEAYNRTGDWERADGYITQASSLAHALGHDSLIAKAHEFDVEIALKRGDPERARGDLLAALAFLAQYNDPETMLGTIQASAIYFLAVGRHRESVMLHALWRRRLVRAAFATELRQMEEGIAELRERVPEASFREYWEIGETLTLDDVRELLFEVPAPPASSAP